MFTGKQYGSQAEKPQYDKLKYSQYDCQAFCELVLRDIGVRQSNGAVYNWRGSNHIWRDGVSWRGTVEEARKKFGCVPVGSWAFMVSNDGGEVARGYNDKMGNASHIAIVVNQTQVRDSTKGTGRDGVAYRKLSDFNMIGIPKMLDFNITNNNIIELSQEEITKVITSLEKIITDMKGWITK